MPRYLSRNCPGGVDLDAHIAHLEWRPVLVLNQIPEKPRSSLAIVLIFGVRHTSDLSDAIFSIISDPNEPAIRRAGRSHQGLWFR
jgi:hypothetical protein